MGPKTGSKQRLAMLPRTLRRHRIGRRMRRWTPILSAIVDGEATPAEVHELRPHLRNCPGCRGRLKAMRESSDPLGAVLPIPLAAAALPSGEPVSNLVLRMYEAVAGGLHDRAAHSVTKVQGLLEVSAAGKVAAVAASAAAVAGGGYVSVEQSADSLHRTKTDRPNVHRTDPARTPTPVELGQDALPGPTQSPVATPPVESEPRDEFSAAPTQLTSRAAPEFAADKEQRGAVPVASTAPSKAREPAASPEFNSTAPTRRGGEFGP